jgi:hypothetical protein
VRKGRKPLKAGHAVVAEWRPGRWYAGKLYKVTSAHFEVKFIDGDRKDYGKGSAKVLALDAALPFDRKTFGPYSEDHAKLLATRWRPKWPHLNKWVVIELMLGRVRRPKWEWHVGFIVKRHRGRSFPSCVVRTNTFGETICTRPEGINYIQHDAPYLLSGPYEGSVLQSLIGRNPKSPLPKPKRTKIIRERPPAPPKIGQRIIGKSSYGWLTGKIANIRPHEQIVEILFDNGKKLGWPTAVEEFRPISSEFGGKNDTYSEDEASSIWTDFGLRRDDLNN